MREFFRGWKRKVGVVTLVMAIAVTVGWIRSIIVLDFAGHESANGSTYVLLSDGSWFGFQYSYLVEETFPPVRMSPVPLYLRSHQKKVIGSCQTLSQTTFEWASFCQFFWIGRTFSTMYGERFITWMFPYWSIVIPLTLLSAYLLLTKPRPATKTVQQPT